jgi:hypothetical protein
LGESDIEVDYSMGKDGVLKLLIENKIDAPPQGRQAERYVLRGEEYLREKKCTKFATVIIAPRYYLETVGNAGEYQAMIDYESIADAIGKRGKVSARPKYRAGMIRAAIEQARRGYQAKVDSRVTSFWKSYWSLSRKAARELEMKEPAEKPANAGFIYFRPSGLPPGVQLVHKLPNGHVDLQMEGKGGSVSQLKESLSDLLGEGMYVVKAGKSASIRMNVPKLDTLVDLDKQKQQVLEALRVLRRLLSWGMKNIDGVTI